MNEKALSDLVRSTATHTLVKSPIGPAHLLSVLRYMVPTIGTDLKLTLMVVTEADDDPTAVEKSMSSANFAFERELSFLMNSAAKVRQLFYGIDDETKLPSIVESRMVDVDRSRVVFPSLVRTPVGLYAYLDFSSEDQG